MPRGRKPQCFGNPEIADCKKELCFLWKQCSAEPKTDGEVANSKSLDDLEPQIEGIEEIKAESKKPEPKKPNKKIERFKNNLINKQNIIRAFFQRITTFDYWLKKLYGFESLLEIIVTDILIAILLTSCGFSIYFLYKTNWIMALVSVAVTGSLVLVLERWQKTPNEDRA